MRAKKASSISNTVYDLLYKNIVNLNLPPGTTISEKEIAEKLNVSRTPVREAFIKLSQEALVNIIPQKGTIVSRIDLARVQEERFLRESLEFSVVDLFVKSKTDSGLLKMNQMIEKQKKALKNLEILEFINYDDEFHRIMFEETNKLLCYNLIKSFSSHYRRIRYLSLKIENIPANVISQHEDLVQALKENNSAKAQSILRKHIQKLIFEKEEIFTVYPDYFQKEEDNIDDYTFIS